MIGKKTLAGLVLAAAMTATSAQGQTAPPPAAMLERLASARSAFVLGRGATLAIAAALIASAS